MKYIKYYITFHKLWKKHAPNDFNGLTAILFKHTYIYIKLILFRYILCIYLIMLYYY